MSDTKLAPIEIMLGFLGWKLAQNPTLVQMVMNNDPERFVEGCKGEAWDRAFGAAFTEMLEAWETCGA